MVSCTTTHSARTVGKDNLGLEASLGGPITTSLGAPIPIPNLFLGARYGLLDDLDISVNYNLTAPIIPGIVLDLQTELHWIPIQPGLGAQKENPADKKSTKNGFSAGGSIGAAWMTDFKSGLIVIPYLDLVAGWRISWFSIFLGTEVGLHFFRPFEQTDVLYLSPYVGFEFFPTEKVGLSLRATWYDITHNAYGSQVDWIYMGQDQNEKKAYAPFGVSLGFSYDFPLNLSL